MSGQSDNHFFALFGLPVSFSIDKSALKTALLALQKQHHPDRMAGETTQVNQNAALINHAYDILAADDSRAAYLLEMIGQDTDLDKSIDDWDFLGEMMDIRITLDELSDIDKLQKLASHVQSVSDQNAAQFISAYNAKNYPAAQDAVRKLKFLAKLLNDAHAKINQSLIKQSDDNDDDLYV